MTTLATRRVVLPPLHPGQQVIAEHPARFKVIKCGRRWGKTTYGVIECIIKAHHGQRCWWIGPTYSIAREGWMMLCQLLVQFPGAVRHESLMQWDFPGGGSIQIKTGDDPDNLRGAGLGHACFDEAAAQKERGWVEVVRAALADHRGSATFISTPKFHNWFYHLYRMAEDPASEDWFAFEAPTWTNPYIAPEEIEQARKEMTDAAFRQEFGAEFDFVANAVYPMLASVKHLRAIDAGAVVGVRGAVGVDFGRVHLSAAVCVTVASDGRYWVRECWAESGGDADRIETAARSLKVRYKARGLRVDPNQDVLAQKLGGQIAKSAAGARNQRISMVTKLLNTDALLFDKGGAGVMALWDELMAYHYEVRETDTNKEAVVARIDDDRVAALEYAIEELETAHSALLFPAEAPAETTRRPALLYRGV